MSKIAQGALTLAFSVSCVGASAQEEREQTQNLEQVIVQGMATANTQPVGTYGSPVSNLEYDPRIDLQSRNMAEAQADVSIRGGIFENTGFRVGSATLVDPQTGHYFAEIPITPEMLSEPNVLTGADNALYGFNSSVGTVDYNWRPVEAGGSVSAGVGTNAFNLQRIHTANTMPLADSTNWQLGAEGEYSRSESDGSIDYGDHNYYRAAGRIQLAGPSSQSDLFFGYQEKFFGWPNLYTPFGVHETENLKTRLLVLNHQQTYNIDSSVEITGYYRRHTDHYVYSRENPSAFEGHHETENTSLGIAGKHRLTDRVAIDYATQVTSDSIESSSLENNFTSRDAYKVSVLPAYQLPLNGDQQLTLRLGAAYDDTNRDDAHTTVIGDIHWQQLQADGTRRNLYISYSEASQVAGYQAIGGSDSSGLFRSSYNLEREITKNLELGFGLRNSYWRLDAALFHRWDKDLTDWTYSYSNTAAREANQVDIETQGLELISRHHLANADIVASYTFLDKSEDYGATSIDASFYALNYPDHRVTLGIIWNPTNMIEVQIDNEWRQQEENLLRNGDDQAFFTHLTVTVAPPQLQGVEFYAAVDNLWDEAFEEVPGTPGRGDQYSLGVTYSW